MKKQQGFGAVELIVSLLVVGILGAVGWVVYSKNADTPTQQGTSEVTQPNANANDDDAKCAAAEDFSVFTDENVGFCFVYPSAWGTASVSAGVINAAQETGTGFTGSFELNEDASFSYISKDWEYTGPGMGGPNHAVGFTAYEKFVINNPATEVLHFSDDDAQIFAYSTDFNFSGATVVGHHTLSSKDKYPGVVFQLNVLATGNFDGMNDSPNDIVTAAHYEQMTAIINSVQEL